MCSRAPRAQTKVPPRGRGRGYTAKRAESNRVEQRPPPHLHRKGTIRVSPRRRGKKRLLNAFHAFGVHVCGSRSYLAVGRKEGAAEKEGEGDEHRPQEVTMLNRMCGVHFCGIEPRVVSSELRFWSPSGVSVTVSHMILPSSDPLLVKLSGCDPHQLITLTPPPLATGTRGLRLFMERGLC
ncbi:hypothetical protein AGIG_G3796 [Arapaima gigas]